MPRPHPRRPQPFSSYRWRSDESWATIPYSNHPYAYALSNPINWADPTGKYCQLPDGSPCPQPNGGALRCGQPGQPACPPPGTGPTPTPTRPNKTGDLLLSAGGAVLTRPNPIALAIGACLVIAGGALTFAVQEQPRTEYVVAPMELVPAPQPATATPMPLPGQLSTPTPNPPAEMRVQLQQGFAETFAISLSAPAETGVTTRQVRDAMNQIYAAAPGLTWFPYTALEPWLKRSIIELSQELKRYPPIGVSPGRQRTILNREIVHNRRDYRIDIEVLRGTNLRS